MRFPSAAARAINQAKAEGRRVVAVGTTTVRTLEYAAEYTAQHAAESTAANLIEAGRGEADVFIYPGYQLSYRRRAADKLSSAAIDPADAGVRAGRKRIVMAAYRHAVDAEYRFYSYGDCMFVE